MDEELFPIAFYLKGLFSHSFVLKRCENPGLLHNTVETSLFSKFSCENSDLSELSPNVSICHSTVTDFYV